MSINDLLQLSRPGSGVQISPTLDRAIWSNSQFDFNAANGNGRTTKSLYIIDNLSEAVQPRQLLSNLSLTETAWLDKDTILFIRPSIPDHILKQHYIDNQGQRQDHPINLSNEDYSKQRKQHSQLEGGNGVELWAKNINKDSNEEYLVAKLPVE